MSLPAQTIQLNVRQRLRRTPRRRSRGDAAPRGQLNRAARHEVSFRSVGDLREPCLRGRLLCTPNIPTTTNSAL
ncbi:MAG: hypothetical protein HS111_29010 [Kofleriaceae bacterium]|nr:hypothetical protein [Kofleriaceae bacterium]